ncbi:MAG: hypothetical protein KH375_06990 [Alistipes sp.]|nr:hypothetical protein [Alistipes sp.]
MKNTKFTCDACEENFKEKTDELIKNATAPTQAEHRKREQEVKAAYGSDTKHPTSDTKSQCGPTEANPYQNKRVPPYKNGCPA